MNLDRTTIAVRERGLTELYDLALLVCRRHAMALAVLAIIGCGPWLAIDGWILSECHPMRPAGQLWILMLLLAVQRPLATAPITAFLGEAMFDEHPSVLAALRSGFRRWPVLLFAAGLWQATLSLLPLLLLMWPTHLVETLVLERTTVKAAWGRANALRSASSSAPWAHLLLAVALAATGLWCIAGTWQALTGILLHADPWSDQSWFDLSSGPVWPVVAAVWLVIVYLAVVRFLGYIDLRTRHEGWEIGLLLQRAARRMEALP